MTEHGTVDFWLPAEGWGVVRTDSGKLVWTSFAAVEDTIGSQIPRGNRSDLVDGEDVTITYEPAEDQDGYTWVAVNVAVLM